MIIYMTNTTNHTNTDTLIACANTIGGWAIGIVRSSHYKTGKHFYRVVRLNEKSQYVTITTHDTETAARTRANAEYRSEMAGIRKAAAA